ncbi:toxin-activating lysine-acyltransferase [Pragia fontium]|uniref:toxin-activating lysine-acyltransferase n=1 Tax=Pragia fontium TaxID=82985 RepID=UPI00069A675D|nr:toxin-activating lysine-acyltransferase [Pragia fontium]
MEQRYLTEPAVMFKADDWTSGDRLWIQDWIAPFGHSLRMKKVVTDIVFPEHFGRMLYHRHARGQVKSWYGKNTQREERERWYQEHPVIG